MSIIKITSLALSVALGMSVAASPGFAATTNSKTSITSNEFQTAHLKKKKKHRHCHTGIRNHRLIKTCHRHRHWPLHHVRKG